MIRVNNKYLDIDASTNIVIDKQAKLFDELDATQKDFSYTFELPYTTNNYQILSFPGPDTASKTIYNDIPCEIIGSDGIPIYTGKLRIEKMNARTITASFFSGNYNWLSLISGDLTDLDFSEYDSDITTSNIINFSARTDGMIFPLVDLGALATRGDAYFRIEDFTGAFFVKTIFRKVLNRSGIKFKGDLVNDWIYNNAIILKNSKQQEKLEATSCYIEKTSTTTRAVENTDYKIVFDNDSTYPFFDGDDNAFDLANSRYVAPFKMMVEVECILQGSFQDANYSNRIRFYINGVYTFVDVGLTVGGLYNTAIPGDQVDIPIKRVITLNAGDILEIYSHWQESTGSTTAMSITGGTLRITPLFIYKVYGNSVIPRWSKKDFVLSILNLFNVISDYDPVSKTVTFDFFEKLKTRTAIDISPYVDPSTIEIDFAEFISGFGKENHLSYNEGDDEDIRQYNINEFVKYGSGVIEVDNDFIEEKANIIQSVFTTPISYINQAFGASLERVNFVEVEKVDTTNFTAAADSSGEVRFTIDDDYFLDGDLVRVEESTHKEYNGDWVVRSVTTGFVDIENLPFAITATGKISKLRHRYTDNDNVFLLINIPNASVPDFSTEPSFDMEENSYTLFSYAYFNLLDLGQAVNTSFKQGLSFGTVDNMLSYQKTLIDTYWRSVSTILNDPVKVKAKFYFPNSVFRSLNPLTPVYLKTHQTTNLYYINRIRGYIKSNLPCEVELIKL